MNKICNDVFFENGDEGAVIVFLNLDLIERTINLVETKLKYLH